MIKEENSLKTNTNNVQEVQEPDYVTIRNNNKLLSKEEVKIKSFRNMILKYVNNNNCGNSIKIEECNNIKGNTVRIPTVSINKDYMSKSFNYDSNKEKNKIYPR